METVPGRSLLTRLFLSPDEPRLRAGWRLLLQLILLFFISMLALVPLMVLQLFGVLPANDTIAISQLGTFFAVTLSVYLARRFLDRRSFSSLGLRLDRWAGRDLFAGVVIAGVIMSLVYVVQLTFGWLDFQAFAYQTMPPLQALLGFLYFLVIFVAVAWQEELFSRGYQLQNLSEGLSLKWGVLLSSIFFALLHLGNPGASWVSVLGLLAAGFFLAFGYVLTRQLWLPIGLHLGWNIFEGPVFGFQVSGLTTFRLLEHTNLGPAWATGGAFGPEAGLVMLPALLLGALLQWLYARWRARAP
jgi:membrane protease YdiL (CAAX protease family)